MISTELVSEVFVEVADALTGDFDVVDFLQTLTERAAAVSGAESVGLMLADGRGQLRYMASSNEGGRLMEMLQLQTEEGPCLDCFRTRQPVVNADLAHAGDRWPRFAPAAKAAGYRSVHAFPLRLQDQVVGALNLFGVVDEPFGELEIPVVQALADVATVALLHERTIGRGDALSEQLHRALNSRIVVEQAKGVIAQQLGLSPAEAFLVLRERARASHRRLSELAIDVVRAVGPGRSAKDHGDV